MCLMCALRLESVFPVSIFARLAAAVESFFPLPFRFHRLPTEDARRANNAASGIDRDFFQGAKGGEGGSEALTA